MRSKHVSIYIAMLASTGGLLVVTERAHAQTYQIQVEESGTLPTSYTKRNNWRILPSYRHTTMVAQAGSPTSMVLQTHLHPNSMLAKGMTRGVHARREAPHARPRAEPAPRSRTQRGPP